MPNLALQEQKKINSGKYGRLILNYLKNYKKDKYIIWLVNNELIKHLYDIENEYKKQLYILIKQLAKKRYYRKIKSD